MQLPGAKLEFIRGASPRPRGPYKKNNLPLVQRRLAQFMQSKLTARWLEEWFDELSPRDQSYFITAMAPYIITKPVQQKDPLENLSDESLEKLAQMISNKARRIYP